MSAAATADADLEPAATKVENAADALLGGNPADEMPAVDLQAVAAAQASGKTAESAENQQNPPPSPAPAAAPAAAPQPASKPVLLDAMGRTFDPLLHETDDGITPKLRADGQTIRCRRMPLKEFKTTSKVDLGTPAPAAGDPVAATTPPPAPMDPEKAKKMREAGARTCAGIQIFIMKRSLGDHVAEKETDQAALVDCWTEMFEHYGLEKMHPIVGLAVVTGMITFDGMKEKETRNAVSRALLWCKVKLGNLFLRVRGRKPEPMPAAEPKEEPAT